MCRWLAYLGSPVALEDVIVKPDHSLIDQSLLARDLFLPGSGMASQFRRHAFPTNGDGFGVAWSGRNGTLGQYRQTTPAWDSQNLRHLAAQIESGCFLAHVRAAPGGAISEQNTHPFVHGGWMFCHNGEINDFSVLKRDLTLDVDPALYPFLQGSSDTEVCFFLALTYGLADDPIGAITRMIARVERARAEHSTGPGAGENGHGVIGAFRGAFAASDGERLIVARWVSPGASESPPPSLFHSHGAITLHTNDGFDGAAAGIETLPADAQLIASEPLGLHWSKRTWHEVPNATIGMFTRGAAPVFTVLDPLTAQVDPTLNA